MKNQTLLIHPIILTQQFLIFKLLLLHFILIMKQNYQYLMSLNLNHPHFLLKYNLIFDLLIFQQFLVLNLNFQFFSHLLMVYVKCYGLNFEELKNLIFSNLLNI